MDSTSRAQRGPAELAVDSRVSEDGATPSSPLASAISPSSGWQQILPAGLEAPSEVVPVASRCSSNHATWERANPIMYNVRLVATKDTRLTAVDLAAHSGYFAALFNNITNFPQDTHNPQCLAVGIAVGQHHLHAIAGALYSSYIRLDATLVEPLLRAADYLQMPCLTAACVTYIRSHLVQAAPVEVYMLGRELQLAELVERAEAVVVQAPWEGENLKHLRALLEGRAPTDVRLLLSNPSRSAVSELEVVEVLRHLSQRDDLAEAINFSRLGPEEVACLGRVLGTLAKGERKTQFWIDISDRVIQLYQSPNSHPCAPGLLLWPIEDRLLTEAHPHGSRIDSGFMSVDGAKYQGSIVYDSHGDAGLFCYPEPMHSLVEMGRKALVTVFVLSQSAQHPLLLKKRLWTPQDTMGLGGGFGQPHCKGHLINDLALSEVAVAGSDGKSRIVIGMHVRHQSLAGSCDSLELA